MTILLATVAGSLVLPACTPSYGFTRSIFGNPLRAEFCESVREFVRQPLDDAGLRRVWFLPFGTGDDGWIDVYAPMAADPHDDAASQFYRQRAGQLTHYATAPEFGFEFTKCLTGAHGFSRIAREMADQDMSGSYRDRRLDRTIRLQARDQTTSIMISNAAWNGDAAVAMSPPGCRGD